MADCPNSNVPKECCICTEPYTKTTRRPFKCTKYECGEECCMTCFKRYYMDSDESDPTCMFCNTHFSLEQISPQITQAMSNEIFNHKAKILCSKEKSLIPSTQPDVIRYKRNIEIEAELQNLILQDKKIFKACEAKMYDDYARATLSIRQKIHILKKEKVTKETTRAVFTYPCPDPDCKGFVSSAWKCGLCKKVFCKDCHEIKDEEHVCDEDTKATIQLIKTDCKNCPKCSVSINLISGCDQMYCTNCFTPFSWKTGKIITGGVIHNPHYFEIGRLLNGQIPRQPGDIPCGGIPAPHELRVRGRTAKLSYENVKIILNCARIVPHITQVVIPTFPTEQNVNTYKQYRIDYCLDSFDEKRWTSKLKSEIKKTEKNVDIVAILNLIVDSITDILQRFNSDPKASVIDELDILKTYVNEQFKIVGDRYKHKSLSIAHLWTTCRLPHHR